MDLKADNFALIKEFPKAGYYETDHQKQMFKDIKAAIYSGKLVALVGIIGCGKTTTLRRLFEVLDKEAKILVSKSLSVDKDRTTLPTLISALFYDLPADKGIKISERERATGTDVDVCFSGNISVSLIQL